MPGYCIEGCKNRCEKGFRLFRIPIGENNRRREEWLKFIGKNTLSARAVICEVHFDDGQYKQARQDEKKLLRPNAIPNLLKKRKAEKEKDEERDMAKKATYSNHIQDLESHEYTETINAETINPEAINVETINAEATDTEANNVDILRDTASNAIIGKEQQIKHLKITLKKTLRLNCQLKKGYEKKM